MSFYETFTMALRNIRSNKTRSLLTMLGIIIGVAAVIVITGLGNGMENYMEEQFENMGSNVMYVSVWGRDGRGIEDKKMQEIVDEGEYLNRMTPTISFSGTKKIGTEDLDSTTVTGGGEDYMTINANEIVMGRDFTYIDIKNRENVCILGSYVNTKYFGGMGVGDKVKINGKDFTVIGVIKEKAKSMKYSSDDAIIVPYTTLARMMNMRKFRSFTVTFADDEKSQEAKTELERGLIRAFNNDKDTFYVQSMTEILDIMNKMTSILITILTIIAAISLLVGGIGIMNIMLVSVTERTKEIGIRKALGAKEKYIMRQFVIEAAVTSAIGGILGITLGYIGSAIFTKVVYMIFQENLIVRPTMLSVLVAVGISAGIGVFFGYMPAKKAALLNPIDALRYD